MRIVVDGGSTDATRDVAEAAGAQVLDVGRGYGRACLAGAEAAPAGAILVYMDGDGADDPARIADLVAPIEAGHARFRHRLAGARHAGAGQSWAGTRWSPAGVFGAAVRLRYGTGYTDMCAFRAIGREDAARPRPCAR